MLVPFPEPSPRGLPLPGNEMPMAGCGLPSLISPPETISSRLCVLGPARVLPNHLAFFYLSLCHFPLQTQVICALL